MFLTLGLFLFMNMLIAIIYTSYSDEVAKEFVDNTQQRDEYFNDMWERYAEKDQNGDLTLDKQNSI
jgi:hypothetical protein